MPAQNDHPVQRITGLFSVCRKAGKNTGNQEQDRKKPFHRQSSFPQETRRFRMQEFCFPVL